MGTDQLSGGGSGGGSGAETFVVASRGGTGGGGVAGGFSNPFTTEIADELDEWDATNDNFSPASDGWHSFTVNLQNDTTDSTADGAVRLQNTTDATTVKTVDSEQNGNGRMTTVRIVANLLSAKTYEIQATRYGGAHSWTAESRVTIEKSGP